MQAELPRFRVEGAHNTRRVSEFARFEPPLCLRGILCRFRKISPRKPAVRLAAEDKGEEWLK